MFKPSIFTLELVDWFKPQLRKNSKPIQLSELTEQEKTEVIQMLMQRIASKAETEWEIHMGDDL